MHTHRLTSKDYSCNEPITRHTLTGYHFHGADYSNLSVHWSVNRKSSVTQDIMTTWIEELNECIQT